MPFTCEGAGSLRPDVALCLATLAPTLAPRDIVAALCSNGRTLIPPPNAGPSTIGPELSRPPLQPVEKIAGLAGYASSRTIEVICRRELRPAGDHDRRQGHGPDLPAEAAVGKRGTRRGMTR
jgi:hypothetical protein